MTSESEIMILEKLIDLYEKGKFDKRELFINKLIKKTPNIKFDLYGMNGTQPLWADNYIRAISQSKMGLNLSQGAPIKYYSSDRIVQLIGNGLLTFIDKRTQLNDLISTKEAVFYNNLHDLTRKIKIFTKNNYKVIKNNSDLMLMKII